MHILVVIVKISTFTYTLPITMFVVGFFLAQNSLTDRAESERMDENDKIFVLIEWENDGW